MKLKQLGANRYSQTTSKHVGQWIGAEENRTLVPQATINALAEVA